MERLLVDSEKISSVGYDTKKGDLEIRFKEGGLYHYMAVPANVYLGLMNSDSTDAYYETKIKDQYVFRKLD